MLYVFPELCQYVGGYVLLNSSAGQVAVVGELLEEAESIDHLWREGDTFVPGGGRREGID